MGNFLRVVEKRKGLNIQVCKRVWVGIKKFFD